MNTPICDFVKSYSLSGTLRFHMPGHMDYGVWDKDLRLGTFDLAMKTQTAELSAATPWTRFSQIMGPIGLKPVGEDAFSNQGRFSNDEANKLLDKIPTIRDEAELTLAYRELNKIFMETHL